MTGRAADPVTITISKQIQDVQHVQSQVWPDSNCSELFLMLFKVIEDARQFFEEQVSHQSCYLAFKEHGILF